MKKGEEYGVRKAQLDRLYQKYNTRGYVHPDPLEFLYRYEYPHDREIAGLMASSLAYGRVAQILKSVAAVLDITGPHPSAFLKKTSPESLRSMFTGFRHRFASGSHLAAMLTGAKQIISTYGSLYACFLEGLGEDDSTVLPALSFFSESLISASSNGCGHLIPLPERGSACKRMNLFLRWMVRKDAVDPGGWDEVPASKLIIPLDVHMHRIATRLGLTGRKQADMRTALEITAAFRLLVPGDPARYDFTLTRLGIRDDIPSDVLNDISLP